jgi:hypothetical protein
MDKVGTVRKEIHSGPGSWSNPGPDYKEDGGWSLWILVARGRYSPTRGNVWTDHYWMCYDSSAEGNPGATFPVGSVIESHPIVGRVARFDEGETIYGPPIGPGIMKEEDPPILTKKEDWVGP